MGIFQFHQRKTDGVRKAAPGSIFGGGSGTSGGLGIGSTSEKSAGRIYVPQTTPSGKRALTPAASQGTAAWKSEQRRQKLASNETQLIAERERLTREQQQANRLAGFLKSSKQAQRLQEELNEINRSLRSIHDEQAQLALTPEQAEVKRLKQNTRKSGSNYLGTLLEYGFNSDQTRQAGRQWEQAKQEKLNAGVHPSLRFANQVNAASSGLVGDLSQTAATAAGLLADYGAPQESAKWLRNVSRAAQAKSDELTAEELRSDAASRYGLDKAGNVGMDVVRMGIDTAMSLPFDLAAPGVGRALDVVDGFGAAARLARRDGASETGAAGYGVGAIGLSLLTGKAGGELSAVFGKKFAGTFLNEAFAKAEKFHVWRKGMPLVLETLGAGGAAVATAVLDPVIQSVYDKGDALSYYFGTPEGRRALVQRAGEDMLARTFFALTGRGLYALGREEHGGRIEDAVERDLQAGLRQKDGVVQTETAVPGGKLTVRQEPGGYVARVVDADGRVQREQRGILTQRAALKAAAVGGTDWVRQQPETKAITAGLERAIEAARGGNDVPARARGVIEVGRTADAVGAEPARAAEMDVQAGRAPVVVERKATGAEASAAPGRMEETAAPAERRTAVATAKKPDAAALLEEAEALLRKAGFDDPYGTERRKLSAEDAARLVEAERVVNEAAQGKAAVQEEAWPGETTDAGSVDAQAEAARVKTTAQRKTADSANHQELFHSNAEYLAGNGEFDLERAKSDLKSLLQNVPVRNRLYLEQALDTVNYVKTNYPGVVAGYSAADDAFLYNPAQPDFGRYDFVVVNLHELSHRIDSFFVGSWENEKFTKTIEGSGKKVLPGLGEHVKYCREKDQDGLLSDIISALSGDEYELPFGHSGEYWQIPGKREKEVFANLFALDALQDMEKLQYLREHFPELMQVYEEMLSEMGI
ncbi:MAG: hypothetical protein PUD44_07910 [Clostridiaceae bacterium]|nr:hypothetical protein [Clostridiaceae bacterium]